MPVTAPTVEDTPANPTWYVYDQFSFDPIVEFEFPPTTLATGELRRAGNKETNYNRVFGHPYSMETFSGETPAPSFDGVNKPVQLGRYKYFYFNHRNDVTSLLKHNGQSLHSYLYDEYGMLYDNNKKPQNASNFTDPHNHYTFSGKEFDEESELSYFGARYYDSWSGTWMTQDLYRGNIFTPKSLQRYQFVYQNPLNLIDLDGFDPLELQNLKPEKPWYSKTLDWTKAKTSAAYEYSKENVVAAGQFVSEQAGQAYEAAAQAVETGLMATREAIVATGQFVKEQAVAIKEFTVQTAQETVTAVKEVGTAVKEKTVQIYEKAKEKIAEKITPLVMSTSDFVKLVNLEQLEQELIALLSTAKTPKERDKILRLLAELAEEHRGISAETKEYIKGFIDKTMQLPGVVFEAAPGSGDIADLYAFQTGETLFRGEKVDPADVAAYAQLGFVTYRQGKIITEGAETVEKIVGGIRKNIGKLLGKGDIKITEKGLSRAEEFVEKTKGTKPAQTIVRFNLNSSQIANLKKFEKNLPKGHGEITIRDLPNGGKVFQSDIPAREIPGSFARYEKQIDSSGETINFTKTTFGPTGEIIHIKPKYPPGHTIYP